jgi:5'-nucleotidase
MKKRFSKQYKSYAFTFLLVLFVFVQGCTSPEGQKTFTLTIAHLNDTHGNLEPSTLEINFNGKVIDTTVGGFPAVTAKIKQLRQRTDHFLFLHAGDVFQGSLYFIKYQGMADLTFLKLMKLDAMCLGNHEFDKGPELLSKFIEEAHKDFPVLCANISVNKEPLLMGKIIPYTIKKFGSRKVGIIGLTVSEASDISSPGDKVSFFDPIKTARTAVTELTAKDINIIIVLSHLGFSEEVELARTVTGVDVVVGGHSHTLMGHFANFLELSPESDYPYVIQNSQKETVLVVQSWEKAKLLGVLNVGFDSAGKVVNYSGHPVLLTGNRPEHFKQKNSNDQKEPVNAETFQAIANIIRKDTILEMIPEDKQAKALLDKFSGSILELKKTVIGQSEVDLLNVRMPGQTHDIAGKLEHGSLIAPVVADALLWKAKSLKNKNTQMVIQNAGNLRCDIPRGDVTIGQVYELLPFGNTMVLFDLKGAEIKEALKAAIIKGDGSFPYTSGLRYTADLNEKDGAFFTSIEVQTKEGWVPLNDSETYHIAANSFIASGKDGYALFEKVKDQYETGFVVAEILMEYVKTFKSLKYPEIRISVHY